MLPILQFWKALPITYSENQSSLSIYPNAKPSRHLPAQR